MGLLVGGNLGELGLVVGASVLGLAAPLTARQILVVNMISELPGLAAADSRTPEARRSGARGHGGARPAAACGTSCGAGSLRRGRRWVAYGLALARGTPQQAQTVALASIITTQLGENVDVGWTEGRVSSCWWCGGGLGGPGVALVVPPVSRFLGLTLPAPAGWVLIGGATALSTGLGLAV